MKLLCFLFVAANCTARITVHIRQLVIEKYKIHKMIYWMEQMMRVIENRWQEMMRMTFSLRYAVNADVEILHLVICLRNNWVFCCQNDGHCYLPERKRETEYTFMRNLFAASGNNGDQIFHNDPTIERDKMHENRLKNGKKREMSFFRFVRLRIKYQIWKRSQLYVILRNLFVVST